MGDPDYKSDLNYSDVVLRTISKDGSISEGFISDKNLMKDYGIKILSWECGQPIKNSFAE